MAHIWIRAEERENEERTGVTPLGVARLIDAGHSVTIEESRQRSIPLGDFVAMGAVSAPEASWPDAPADAIIFGLKELPETDTPLRHRHIMFGHAYKGQPAGQRLLKRFKAGGGTLYDLEYLVDDTGRRVAAFGYWAGFAGAAVSVLAWAAAERGGQAAPVSTERSAEALVDRVKQALSGLTPPDALIIGALGRVGTGAAELCRAVGVRTTLWDMAETASGGPFPQVLDHGIFLNCILARPGTPVFVPATAKTASRTLRVIGDIACDPDSAFSPVKVYDRATTWADPVVRVHDDPVLDVMAIDNLPSLLPRESSEDFAAQLLPHLIAISAIDSGVWGRAKSEFDTHLAVV